MNRLGLALKTRIKKLSRVLPPNFFPVLLFVFIGIFLGILQFIQVRFGDRIFWDAREVWYPLAREVSNGVPLYGTSSTTDNKPPLWQYINIGVYQLPVFYYQAMYLFVGLANGLTSGLMYLWHAYEGRRLAGATAGIVWLSVLPVANGDIINVRSFALVGIMAALLAQRAWTTGIWVAVAGLISQWSIFIAPVIAWQYRSDVSDIVRFAVSGAGFATITYLSVFLWGEISLITNAINSSIVSIFSYSQNVQNTSYKHPVIWMKRTAAILQSTPHVWVPFSVAIIQLLRKKWLSTEIPMLMFAFTLFSFPIIIKFLRYYYLLPLAAASLVVGSVSERLISTQDAESRL